MKVQSCKNKGRRLQQEVVSDIMNLFPELSGNDVRSTSMGANGEDVIMSPLTEACFPYSVECKNCERLSIWNAIEQAKLNCNGKTPIVVFKKNRSLTHVCLPWQSFLDLHRHRELTRTNDRTADGHYQREDNTAVCLIEDEIMKRAEELSNMLATLVRDCKQAQKRL